MKMLQKIMDCESLEISQENFIMEFLSVKLQAYSVQAATLLKRELTKDSSRNMYWKLVVLKNKKRKSIFLEKSIWWTSVLIKLQTFFHESLGLIPSILLKRTPPQQVFLREFCTVALFKSYRPKSIRYDFVKNNMFDKNI